METYNLPLGYDTKSTLYKKNLSGPIINHIQDYIYPSRMEWKNVFSRSLQVFTQPRDVVLLYSTAKIPIHMEYEWADRLPPLMDCNTGIIKYWNDN